MMEFYANEGKQVEIEANGKSYLRHAVKTHFIGVGESLPALVQEYIVNLYQPGDILSISEKIVSLCQGRIVYKADMRVGPLARLLSRFASRSTAGIGVDSPYKMQYAIDACGRAKILYASLMGGIGKLMGKHGVFYEIAGREVSGLDGFYDHAFAEYGEFGIQIPENTRTVCQELYETLGISCMVVDANDYGVEILGKSGDLTLPDAELAQIIRDNPANNFRELTPFVLIRPKVQAETLPPARTA